MSDASVSWLTQEAYDRLSAELEHLSVEGRGEIAKKIEAAREEGDLKENGGYHAAKEEQGKIEARIRTLTELLRHAKVGEAPASSGVVEPGRWAFQMSTVYSWMPVRITMPCRVSSRVASIFERSICV